MKQRMTLVLTGLFYSMSLGLLSPRPAHAQGTWPPPDGAVQVAFQSGPPEQIQVQSGDPQQGEAVANWFTGKIGAALFDGTLHLIDPDQLGLRYAILSPVNGSTWQGQIYQGPLAGATITIQGLGQVDAFHSAGATEVQWNDLDVTWQEIATTISSYNYN